SAPPDHVSSCYRAPQHIAFTTRAQLPAKPRVAPQLIVTCHPAVRDLLAPQVEHLQTLLGTRAIPHLRHMAYLASVFVPSPLLGQRQAEIEQGMVLATNISHKDADLAVVDLAPVTTPLPFHPDRMSAPFGKAAGIESNDPIGLPQPLDHLPNQHARQRVMIPRGGADEVLHDQALDIDQGHNLL